MELLYPPTKLIAQLIISRVLSVCAHSMGGIVMMESLKQLAAASQVPLNNLVLMQAAVPAHCFDTSITNLPAFLTTELSAPTPDAYRNYGAGITSALRPTGKLINFFNQKDFALSSGFFGIGSWEYNQSFRAAEVENGPVTMKPNTFLGYYTDGTNSLLRTNYWNQRLEAILLGTYYGNRPTRTVTSVHELMPFVARPRSKAVGSQAGVHGQLQGGELDLETALGFTEKIFDHSGQFNRNVQDSSVAPFYFELRRNLFP